MKQNNQHQTYEVIERDLRKFIKNRVSENSKEINDAYDGKYEIITLKGSQVKDYLKNIINLLERLNTNLSLWYSSERYDDDFNLNKTIYILNMTTKILQNLRVLYRIKDNFIIEGWKKDLPKFSDLLTLDIDKRTGLPSNEELGGIMGYVKAAKEFDRQEVNKFFDEWIKNLNKLNTNDYINLLNMSNKLSLRELNLGSLKEIKKKDIACRMMVIEGPKKKLKKSIDINNFGYNIGGGLEFIFARIISDQIIPEKNGMFTKIGMMIKKIPVLEDDKKGLILDNQFEDVFNNNIVNDPKFVQNQISEILFRVYDIINVEHDVQTFSIGIKTPYNNINKDFFPELNHQWVEDYYIVVREQDSDAQQVEYTIIGA